MAPLRTVGMALHMLATRVMITASVAVRPVRASCASAKGLAVGIKERKEGLPMVRMEEPAVHVEIVTKSENQYVMKASFPQVRFSTGTGSMSGLVHTYSGATLLSCFSSFQLEGSVILRRAFSLAAMPRSRS